MVQVLIVSVAIQSDVRIYPLDLKDTHKGLIPNIVSTEFPSKIYPQQPKATSTIITANCLPLLNFLYKYL